MTRAPALLLSAFLLAGCTPPTPPPGPSRPPREESRQSIQPDFGEPGDRIPEPSRSRRRRSHSPNSSQPGVFDFYLLNLSWSPEFCATHSGSPECSAHPGFVVHGLWPQNNDGTYPQNCSDEPGPANPGQYTNLLPTTSLVEHEWSTHGTCSGLAPDAYFAQIGRAFHQIVIPPSFTHTTQPFTLSPGAIIAQFAAANPSLPPGSIALSCGNNYLTAVEVCLSKTLTPQACQSIHTCGATSVKITPQ